MGVLSTGSSVPPSRLVQPLLSRCNPFLNCCNFSIRLVLVGLLKAATAWLVGMLTHFNNRHADSAEIPLLPFKKDEEFPGSTRIAFAILDLEIPVLSWNRVAFRANC